MKKKKHIVLLGDSTLDNSAYTGGAPDVTGYMRGLAGDDVRITLLGDDGATVSSVYLQIESIPPDATHLTLSVGGNNAFGYRSFLDASAISVEEVLLSLYKMASDFKEQYTALIARLLQTGLPLLICTIYEGFFDNPVIQKKVNTALCVFNDVIIRTAFRNSLEILDLRDVCCNPEHFTSIIEPSGAGGERIAESLWERIFVSHKA